MLIYYFFKCKCGLKNKNILYKPCNYNAFALKKNITFAYSLFVLYKATNFNINECSNFVEFFFSLQRTYKGKKNSSIRS